MRKIKLTKVLICICTFAMVSAFAACANHTDHDGNEEVSQAQINISEQESEIVEEQGTEEAQENTLTLSPEAEMTAESESETETETMMDLYGPVDVSELDYDSFQSRMTDEEWEGFQLYFPILKENAEFYYAEYGEELNQNREPLKKGEYLLYLRYTFEETMNIDCYLKTYYEDDVAKVEDIRVFDLDGDGVQELIVQWTPVGELLVFHCEKGEFYGWDINYRGFEGLQTNGVYISSGGARSNRLKRICFDNGSWLEEVLLEEDWGKYYVGGEAVDEDTFWQQFDSYEAEEVTRYEPMRLFRLN